MVVGTDTEKTCLFKNPMKTCRKNQNHLCSLFPVPTHTDRETDRNRDVHLTEQLYLPRSKSPPKSTLPSDVQKAFQLIPANPSQPVWCPRREARSHGRAEPSPARRTGRPRRGGQQCQASISRANTHLTTDVWKGYQEFSVCLV